MGNQAPKTDKPILVTGASGYIASYIIQKLLSEGYHVRGTVRSIPNKHKYAHLLKLHNSQNLSFVEADLNDQKCWDPAVNGCDYVVHVASPIPPYVPKDEDEIIKPAVAGAKYCLEASIRNHVKRFVFTSSCLTLVFGNSDKILDQGMWSDLSLCSHYPKSKTLAEKAIWELYNQQNLQVQHTEVVSILPCLVLGPELTGHNNSSEAFIAEILRGNYPGVPDPDVMFSVVDVRDAALGHCLALFKDNLDGQRVALSGGQIFCSEVIDILHKQYPNRGIKTQKIDVEGIKASGNAIAQRNIHLMGKRFEVNNQKSIDKLGMKYRPLKETIIEMAQQLEKLGLIN